MSYFGYRALLGDKFIWLHHCYGNGELVGRAGFEKAFEYLEQWFMSMTEYLAKFICLERFAPGLVATKKMWVD